MNLKDKFEFVERVSDMKISEGKRTQILYMGERPKSLFVKEIFDQTFYDIKNFLKMITNSEVEVEVDFTCSPFDSLDELKMASNDILELLKKCSKIFGIEGVNYFVEINLSYDLELYISGEVQERVVSVESLKERIPLNSRLRMIPRIFGKDGMWESFVIKCELEKFESVNSDKGRGIEL